MKASKLPRARFILLALFSLMQAAASPARAAEVFGGVFAHDVESPLTLGGLEEGADLQIGWRGERLQALRAIGSPSPYAFASVSTGGETHFAAAGLSWRLGDRWFVRPGIGLAVHTRGQHGVANGFRTDLGSRLLFEPELGVGYQVSPRLSVELSWIHISHAQLLGPQNPGMDSVGLRVSYRMR